MIDHAGLGVSDYERSKAFYTRALAPLGITLLMEPMGRAAGFARAASRSSSSRPTAHR